MKSMKSNTFMGLIEKFDRKRPGNRGGGKMKGLIEKFDRKWEAWVVYNYLNGLLYTLTVRDTRKQSRAVAHSILNSGGWGQLKSQGYCCIRVEIVPVKGGGR